MIALGPWPMMIAHLLLVIVGDEESRLEDDLGRARRLAALLSEGAEVTAALSRMLLEPPPSEKTVPHVEVRLARWTSMRAQLLLGAVVPLGSAAAASLELGVSAGSLRRALRQARRGSLGPAQHVP